MNKIRRRVWQERMKWQNKIEIEGNMKEKKLLITIHEVAWKKKPKHYMCCIESWMHKFFESPILCATLQTDFLFIFGVFVWAWYFYSIFLSFGFALSVDRFRWFSVVYCTYIDQYIVEHFTHLNSIIENGIWHTDWLFFKHFDAYIPFHLYFRFILVAFFYRNFFLLLR